MFTTQIPNFTDENDGDADYELGMIFKSSVPGQIWGIRYYRALSETGSHQGRLWSAGGAEIAHALFTSEIGSGWQQQLFPAPVNISAGTPYMASVNVNIRYVYTGGVWSSSITNGPLTAYGAAYNITPGSYPNTSNTANYFVDILFLPDQVGVIEKAATASSLEFASLPIPGARRIIKTGKPPVPLQTG